MDISEGAFEELVRRRRDLLRLLSVEKDRLSRAGSPYVKGSIQALVDTLTGHIGEIENELDAAFEMNPEIREKDRLLQSVPGIDAEMSRKLLRELPELGTMSNRQIAGFVGVAPPKRKDNGYGEYQKSRGGDPFVRQLVHSITQAAMQCDGKMEAFHSRLIQGGKPENVAIVACMRKMLVILNSILKKKEVYSNREAFQPVE